MIFEKLNFTLKNFEENLEKKFLPLTLKIKENLNEENKYNILNHIKNNNLQLSLFFPDNRYSSSNITRNIKNFDFNNKNMDSFIDLILKMKDFYLDYSSTKIYYLFVGKSLFEDFTKYYDENNRRKIKINY